LERLPYKSSPAVAGLLGPVSGELTIIEGTPSQRPRIAVDLVFPLVAASSLRLRVHSASGIPLALCDVQLAPGATRIQSGELAFLGIEGYGHLPLEELRPIEERIWSRRSFVTLDTSGPAGARR